LNHSIFDLNDENKEIMLCTDGFWEHFDEDTVVDLMKDNPEANLVKFTKISLEMQRIIRFATLDSLLDCVFEEVIEIFVSDR
jgi:serine/threonine protein phosphatase PrpC